MKHRLLRVSEMLLRELGTIVLRDLTFPVPLVTIQAVDVTPDLKNAHVFVSAIASPDDRDRILKILEDHRVHLQHELARRVSMKQTPHLHFRFDESIERGSRVLELLDEIDRKAP